MALYSICSLVIEADILPDSYQPFLLAENDYCGTKDMTIKWSKLRTPSGKRRKAADLQHVTIWKEDLDNNYYWIYVLPNRNGEIYVDAEYTTVEMYVNDLLISFGEDFLKELIRGSIQMILQCKLLSYAR